MIEVARDVRSHSDAGSMARRVPAPNARYTGRMRLGTDALLSTQQFFSIAAAISTSARSASSHGHCLIERAPRGLDVQLLAASAASRNCDAQQQ
jgi:hypothetical protein